MKTYSYYPGCTLEGTEFEYDRSCRSVCSRLGIGLEEIPDWNCCGALETTSDKALTLSLSARNAAIAERMEPEECVIPCNICYNNMKKAQAELSAGTKTGKIIESSLASAGLECRGDVKIRHLLDVLVNDVGLERIAEEVRYPLDGLKVAPYYGCLVVRPSVICQFDDPHNPTSMDRVLKALGAEVIEDFSHKVRCCGGSVLMGDTSVAFTLTRAVLEDAISSGADCISLVCPMCHTMLDAQQGRVEQYFGEKLGIPVVYLTQLMGMAFGLSESEVALNKNIVSAKRIWRAVR